MYLVSFPLFLIIQQLSSHGKKRNVAVAAIARELACFVWGMMTDNIEVKAA